MVSGTARRARRGLRAARRAWIAVAVADRPVGSGHARVRLGAVIDEDVGPAGRGNAGRAGRGALGRRRRRGPAGGAAGRRRTGGAAAAGRRPRSRTGRPARRAAPGRARAAALVARRRRSCGTGSRFLRLHLGEPWPEVSDDALHARVDEWLEPELAGPGGGPTSRGSMPGQGSPGCFRGPPGRPGRLDELAPGADRRTQWVPDPDRLRQPRTAGSRREVAGDVRVAASRRRVAGYRCWCIFSPRPAGPPPSPPTSPPSGRTATGRTGGAARPLSEASVARGPGRAEPTRYTNARLRR